MSSPPQQGLPGYGLPVNYVPRGPYQGSLDDSRLFPNALANDEWRHIRDLTTLREFAMMSWMDEVSSKADWYLEVNDAKITRKWKEEILTARNPDDFSGAMVDHCIAELQDRAKVITNPNNPPPYLVFDAGVYRSDTAVSLDLKKEIQDAVNEFEDRIPRKRKDWRPHSDDRVLDLVHPSLFPLVYGKSRILPHGETVTLEDCITRCGDGEIIPVPTDDEIVDHKTTRYSDAAVVGVSYSKRFQWLPCDVDIEGPEAKITSYINNLHPVHDKRLYDIIERVITAAIPVWELTLARIHEDHRPDLRIHCDSVEYDQEARDDATDSEGDQDGAEDGGLPPRKLVYPEPGEYFAEQEVTPFDLRKYCGDKGLQVIVKLTNIHLTPEKPDYPGESWQVEGQLNEHIVSTALYYYSDENITQSSLSFRQRSGNDETGDIFEYDDGDHYWLERYFGCENNSPGVQEIGHVNAKEGRLLTFPNTLQHRVEPFKLKDPTKPGRCKIIALFLVDPNIKIISTANVPCQQREWWWELVTAQRGGSGSGATPNKPQGFEKLPAELKQHVFDDVDFAMTLETAKNLRLELMEERKAFLQNQNLVFEEAPFTLREA